MILSKSANPIFSPGDAIDLVKTRVFNVTFHRTITAPARIQEACTNEESRKASWENRRLKAGFADTCWNDHVRRLLPHRENQFLASQYSGPPSRAHKAFYVSIIDDPDTLH